MIQRYFVKSPFILIVCYLLSIGFFSCNDSDKSKQVDVSNIQVKLNSIRFDKELYACDTNNIEVFVNQLGNKYPDFASVYFNELTGFSKNDNQAFFHESVRHFLTYKDYRALFDTVFFKYPNVKNIDAELETLFKHIKYYYPEKKLGDVYYFISGLNMWSAVTIDTAIGIGLDMHLGKTYPFYAAVQIPDYQIARCEKEYIPVNVARAIYEDTFTPKLEGKNLLDMIIMKGKEQVFLEHVLPNAKDELLMGYTPEQLAWCQENEGMIWSYFAKQKLLYSTQWQEILRYVNDGPTSTGMPAESPGNIGTFIGWQLVRKYLQSHPNVKWTALMKDQKESQQFLQESGYKPR